MSQTKTKYSDSDSGEEVHPEFPAGLLRCTRCTANKPAFSKTPSPKKESHQARLLAQPTHLHSSRTRRIHREVSTAAATTARGDTPVSDGTRAWVADSFVEGQPLSDRRKVARRRALTMDLTGDPPPKRVSTSSWDRFAATCPSTSATKTTTSSEFRGALRATVCLGCLSECV